MQTTIDPLKFNHATLRFATDSERKSYHSGLAEIARRRKLAAPIMTEAQENRVAAKLLQKFLSRRPAPAPAKPKAPARSAAPPAPTVKTYHRIFHRGLF